MNDWEALEGSPRPLGASFVSSQQAWNFALYSKHATAVTLHLYRDNDLQTPQYTYPFNPLLNKSGRVWHCRLPAARVNDAHFYAYQIDGPFDLKEGHRFDPQKSLLDPYSRVVFFRRRLTVRPPFSLDRTSARHHWVLFYLMQRLLSRVRIKDRGTPMTRLSTNYTSGDLPGTRLPV